jgi:hypothetical protein
MAWYDPVRVEVRGKVHVQDMLQAMVWPTAGQLQPPEGAGDPRMT